MTRMSIYSVTHTFSSLAARNKLATPRETEKVTGTYSAPPTHSQADTPTDRQTDSHLSVSLLRTSTDGSKPLSIIAADAT
mmetsp:Transcript_27542/g.68665  ORF Transcript_27542/g.68665 Transcript_27542/m.68665 type:complete len:80 (-) Transcript_27542:517-756(-)